MAEITIDGRELLKTVKLGIRMPRALGLRIWVATRLFELAGWVSGTTVTVDVGDEPEDTDGTRKPSPTATNTVGTPPPHED